MRKTRTRLLSSALTVLAVGGITVADAATGDMAWYKVTARCVLWVIVLVTVKVGLRVRN
ncbi:hypothetical protein HFO56_23285 [Rhizobium laguerreae]|uniref:hypothetical protein n=1 Tax=Rhizobium laguerreae TaxID=1076926 RepID=UPI001C92B18D|nr:hypothetical protein [Rhizobium laguerreae]MBY3155250.1 hypothetical protein [Rhizobium laguerreae]